MTETQQGASTNLLPRLSNAVLWFVKDQWFLVGIAIVIVIASQVQVPAQHQEQKQVLVSYLAGELQSVSVSHVVVSDLLSSFHHILHHWLHS